MKVFFNFRINSNLVLLFSFVSLYIFILFFDYFYNSVILRGLIEAKVWLGRIDRGDFAREYYHIIHYMIEEWGFSISTSVNILSSICLFYAIKNFRWLLNYRSLIYFLLTFNLFSLLLIYSPGRTSLTVLFLLICYSGYYPKINTPKLILGIIGLVYLHRETLLMFVLFISFGYIISAIDGLFKNKWSRLTIKSFFYVSLVTFLSLLLNLDNSYVEITNGAGNMSNIAFIFIIIFSVYLFSSKDYFILLFVLAAGLILVLGLNASYIYRVAIFPIVIGVYFRQQYYERGCR